MSSPISFNSGMALADSFFDLGIRRANLEGFPYHLLYRVTPSGVRVFVLRHDRRNPSFGKRRK